MGRGGCPGQVISIMPEDRSPARDLALEIKDKCVQGLALDHQFSRRRGFRKRMRKKEKSAKTISL